MARTTVVERFLHKHRRLKLYPLYNGLAVTLISDGIVMTKARTTRYVHTRHLRIILRIKWQDIIPNTEVLKIAQTTSIEASLIKAQLRWTGHVLWMKDGRLQNDPLTKN